MDEGEEVRIVLTCRAVVMTMVVVGCLRRTDRPLGNELAAGYERLLVRDLAEYLWRALCGACLDG